MRKYKRDKMLFLSLLIAYSAIATIHKFSAAPKPNIFPVFAWDLFVRVPFRTTEYRLYLESHDGKNYAPPYNLQQMMKPFKRQDPANFFALPLQIKEALESGNLAEADRLHSLLRARYFPAATQLRYSLYEAKYDPLEKWRNPAKEELTLLQSFNYAKGAKE